MDTYIDYRATKRYMAKGGYRIHEDTGIQGDTGGKRGYRIYRTCKQGIQRIKGNTEDTGDKGATGDIGATRGNRNKGRYSTGDTEDTC